MKQTILGSGGAIGIPLAKELKKYTGKIRLVSRNPIKVNDTDEPFPIDLSHIGQIDKAISGSEVVYLTVGFEYNLKVWQDTWPPFMRTVIDACKNHGARLVFFDNIYVYPPSAVPFMTEDSPVQPSSRKGLVRKELHDMIMEDVDKKKLTALIVRSADFYGPDNKNSALAMMVAKRFIEGKKAQVFGNMNKVHTYTYTPDAAKATAILGHTADAFNQVWHVPTTKEKLTTKQWIDLIAEELRIKPKVQTVPAWMVKAMGLFMPIMKEFPEMMYQFEEDYILDSSKFEKRFGLKATQPKEGIKSMMDSLTA
jgi:nucleoside-diphosphate-sugar epimerase